MLSLGFLFAAASYSVVRVTALPEEVASPAAAMRTRIGEIQPERDANGMVVRISLKLPPNGAEADRFLEELRTRVKQPPPCRASTSPTPPAARRPRPRRAR